MRTGSSRKNFILSVLYVDKYLVKFGMFCCNKILFLYSSTIKKTNSYRPWISRHACIKVRKTIFNECFLKVQNKMQKLPETGEVHSLPSTVVQKLEEAGIPQDSLIFYKNSRWVYQKGQPLLNNNQFRCQPIDSLGPFGKNLDDIPQKYIDKCNVIRYTSC